MTTLLRIEQIETLPGQKTVLHEINWEIFESILADLGDKRNSRIAYFDKTLEIRMPLPEHERAKVMISNFLVILLEEMNWEWESLGSSTFKKENMQAGIEPDDCFYIQNYAAIVGKTRLDLTVDPPPDIAIEVDLTSSTQLNAYLALGVSEVWQYKNNRLAIHRFQDGCYVESDFSKLFPAIPIAAGISQFLALGAGVAISTLRREFRQWLKLQILSSLQS